jgi:hypothetical protein
MAAIKPKKKPMMTHAQTGILHGSRPVRNLKIRARDQQTDIPMNVLTQSIGLEANDAAATTGPSIREARRGVFRQF